MPRHAKSKALHDLAHQIFTQHAQKLQGKATIQHLRRDRWFWRCEIILVTAEAAEHYEAYTDFNGVWKTLVHAEPLAAMPLFGG